MVKGTLLNAPMLLMATCGLMFGHRAWAAAKKPAKTTKASECVKPLRGSKFDPAAVLEKHGLDPKKVNFTANLTYRWTNQNNFYQGFSWGVRLYYGGEEAGFIGFGKGTGGFTRAMWVSLVEVKEKYQGKGLGTILHLVAAKYAYDHFGLILQMSDETYPQEQELWERFGAKKWLEPWAVPTLKESLLKGPAFNQTRDYFKSHVENDTTPFEDKFLDGYRLP